MFASAHEPPQTLEASWHRTSANREAGKEQASAIVGTRPPRVSNKRDEWLQESRNLADGPREWTNVEPRGVRGGEAGLAGNPDDHGGSTSTVEPQSAHPTIETLHRRLPAPESRAGSPWRHRRPNASAHSENRVTLWIRQGLNGSSDERSLISDENRSPPVAGSEKSSRVQTLALFSPTDEKTPGKGTESVHTEALAPWNTAASVI
jgi:hypothetical protein